VDHLCSRTRDISVCRKADAAFEASSPRLNQVDDRFLWNVHLSLARDHHGPAGNGYIYVFGVYAGQPKDDQEFTWELANVHFGSPGDFESALLFLE
jgi:hypothetical protein